MTGVGGALQHVTIITLACGDFSWSACQAFLGAQGAGASSLHGRKLLRDPVTQGGRAGAT